MKKSRARSIIFMFLKLGIAGGLLYLGFRNQRFDKELLIGLADRWPYAAAGIIIMLGVPAFGCVRWWALVRAQGIALSLRDAAKLTYIGLFLSVFLPGVVTGDLFKAYYVAKGKGRERRAEAITTIFLDRVAGLFGLALLAATVMTVNIPMIEANPKLRALAIFFGSAVAVGIIGFFIVFHPRLRERRKRLLSGRGAIWQTVDKVDDAVHLYRDRKLTVLAAMALSIGNHVAQIAAVWLFARALGGAIPLHRMLLLVPIGFMVNAIPIGAPGGVGQGEVFFQWLLLTTEGFSLGATNFLCWRLANLLAVSPGALVWVLHRAEIAEVEHEMEEAEEEAPPAEDAVSETPAGQ